MTKEEAVAEIGNRVYQASCSLFEKLEGEGYIRGNGHHIAQVISKYAKEIMKNRFISNVKDKND